MRHDKEQLFPKPPTAFTRHTNRATADTTLDAALDERLTPLMGWVKRLADHVIQDHIGARDLEFVWGDLRPADPAEQAKILDIYVRDGIYAVNEARSLLGLAPVPGGELPMVYGTQGAVPLGGEAAKIVRAGSLRKYNPNVEDEPRVPAGNPDGGQWTSDGGAGSVSFAPEASSSSSSTGPRDAGTDSGQGESSPALRSFGQFAPSLVTVASSSEPPGNGPYQPGGTIVTPLEGVDPLDPHGLNTEPSPEEQRGIADTVTAIQQGDVGGLQPHPYKNMPSNVTGAVLPPSADGYTAYDVKGTDPGRGEGRILVDKSTGAMYYTSNHYKSFYPIVVAPASR